ncbi:tyrosine-type recombinase/integrase [candidate division KSB1 bacterium]|nr:tyrosine-type recombinase/integrase [candidate division KSB1 bacterium]
MAYLRKIKNTWQLQFYLDGKRRYKTYSPDTPKSILSAEKKRIESEIALHKAGIKRFNENDERVDFITLRELTEKVCEIRKNEVSDDTISRNLMAMKCFTDIIGADMPVSNIETNHFDQFKKARFECGISEYERKGWNLDKDKIKVGVNKDLSNIKTILKAAAHRGIVSESMLPKIEFFKVDYRRLPKYLNDDEVIAIANHLKGDALLAFWIIRYTGGRRGEIARKSRNAENGLKWSDVDWMRNVVRLYAKKKERLIPLHPKLRKLLLDRKTELGAYFYPEDHIIRHISQTLTTKFKEAMKNAGIDKPGSVHILRHTAATKILRASKNIRTTQEFMGHSNITTTEIYTHVIEGEVDKAVKEAFD